MALHRVSLPLAPFPVLVRLGAQPFLSMYKLGVYTTGDFAGECHMILELAPEG